MQPSEEKQKTASESSRAVFREYTSERRPHKGDTTAAAECERDSGAGRLRTCEQVAGADPGNGIAVSEISYDVVDDDAYDALFDEIDGCTGLSTSVRDSLDAAPSGRVMAE